MKKCMYAGKRISHKEHFKFEYFNNHIEFHFKDRIVMIPKQASTEQTLAEVKKAGFIITNIISE